MYSCIKNCIFLKIKMIINEQEFCWRLCCRAFYFMFPQKQAWFPSTNKFTLYSNAWHMYAKVLEIRRIVPYLYMVCITFLLFSSFIKSGWWVDSETLCEETFIWLYIGNDPKNGQFFFSHLRWQNVLYLAESLHSCPIHWYVLTILLIKPCGKCKLSIIPRIRLAICLSIHVWNWFDCEEGKFVFECIEHSRWVFRKTVSSILKSTTFNFKDQYRTSLQRELICISQIKFVL